MNLKISLIKSSSNLTAPPSKVLKFVLSYFDEN